jgi:phosphotransferase system enzyme I (PtsP)
VFEEQLQWAASSKKAVPRAVRFGAMLEVPSLAEMLDVLLPRIDFLSIGTNDLTQFLFAADRADPRLAERYDWLSPAILRFLKRIVDQADAAGVPVRICGEMGGRPLEALALIGIGIRNFSITPAAVGPIKAMVRTIDEKEVSARIGRLLANPTTDMRKRLADWAKRHRIALG